MPIWPPPPGVESNFVDPENIAYMIYAAIGVTMPLALLACGLRLYTSKAIVGRWHVDDSMCDGFHPWGLLSHLASLVPRWLISVHSPYRDCAAARDWLFHFNVPP